VNILTSFGPLHNSTDTESRKRLIRAIEIAEWKQQHPESFLQYPPIEAHIIGLNPPVEVRRERIARRLDQRLQDGLVDEARRLMEGGLSVEDMMYYGLEYKFLALYLTGALSYDEMQTQLNIAIRQFAKRQMTWFRGMERRGFQIHWQ
jgi:tRNA delta(2)-isopentenylpyrophosphate transferase